MKFSSSANPGGGRFRLQLLAGLVGAWLGLAGAPRAHGQLSAASGAVEVPGGTGTRQITRPGTYFLSGDLVAGGNDGLQILASNVTLDLNGHTVTTAAPGAANDPGVYNSGIYSPNTTNVTVRHGRINGFLYGVYLAGGYPNSYGHRLEDLSLDGNTAEGIYLTGGQSVVRRCTVTRTGGGTQPVGLSSCAVLTSGPGNRVLECDVAQVTAAAGTGGTFGVFFWNGSSDGFAWKNRVSGADTGLFYDGTSAGRYAQNLIGTGVANPYVGGTDAGHNGRPGDADGNGLDDAWEQKYFGHVGVDPNAQPDGDGLTVLQKYQQGVVPGKKDNPLLQLVVTVIAQ